MRASQNVGETPRKKEVEFLFSRLGRWVGYGGAPDRRCQYSGMSSGATFEPEANNFDSSLMSLEGGGPSCIDLYTFSIFGQCKCAMIWLWENSGTAALTRIRI